MDKLEQGLSNNSDDTEINLLLDSLRVILFYWNIIFIDINKLLFKK
jgi:hypothetical protein